MLHDASLEKNVLGCAMIDSGFMEVLADVDANIFYNSFNRSLFTIMRDMHRSGRTADVVTIGSYIKEANLTFEEISPEEIDLRLMDYSYASIGASNALAYVSQLTDLHTKRKLEETLLKLQRNLNSTQSPTEIADEAISLLEKATSQSLANINLIDGNNIEGFRREQMQRRLDETKSNIFAGFPSIDRLMPLGFIRPGISIIGALPKAGKTTFARNLICHMCDAGHSVVLWSGEMRSEREIDLLASIDLAVPYEDFQNKAIIKSDKFIRQVKTFDQKWKNIWKLRVFDDLPMPSNEFFAKVALLDSEQKIDILVIDMMDFFEDVVAENDPGRRSYVMGKILLKAVTFAKKRDLHVMCLWQWDMPERRHGKVQKPSIMDFRLSRAAVEKADQIILLHRPKLVDSNIADDYTEVILAVQRGTVKGGSGELYLGAGLRLIDSLEASSQTESPF
jgi:replicative DNA helicase